MVHHLYNFFASFAQFLSGDKLLLYVLLLVFFLGGLLVLAQVKSREKIVLALFLTFIPFETGFIYTRVLKVDLIQISDILLVVLVGYWLMRTNFLSKGDFAFGTFTFPAALMLLWSVFSLVPAESQLAAGFGVFMMVKTFLLYFYLLNYCNSKEKLLWVINVIMIGLLFQGFLGVVQYTTGSSLGLGFLGAMTKYGKAISRVRGTMGFPNQFGAYLILLLPLAISLAISARSSLLKLFYLGTSVFGLFTLMFTFSRSSWAGFLFTTAVFMFLMLRRGMLRFKYVVGAGALVILIAGIAMAFWDLILLRFETGAEAKWRLLMIEISFPIIAEHPVFGVGLNNYQWHSFDEFRFWHPVHNDFLRLAAEIGIPGCLFFMTMLFVTLRHAYKQVVSKDKFSATIASGAICCFVAFMVAINFGPEYQVYRIQLVFWVLTAIVFSLGRIRKLERLQAVKTQQMMKMQPRQQRPELITRLPDNGNRSRP